jgi:hypothetical protein
MKIHLRSCSHCTEFAAIGMHRNGCEAQKLFGGPMLGPHLVREAPPLGGGAAVELTCLNCEHPLASHAENVCDGGVHRDRCGCLRFRSGPAMPNIDIHLFEKRDGTLSARVEWTNDDGAQEQDYIANAEHLLFMLPARLIDQMLRRQGLDPAAVGERGAALARELLGEKK